MSPHKDLRKHFIFPRVKGKRAIYFCGNSLGLQPKRASEHVKRELNDWGKMAVDGHFKEKNPWYSYHETVTQSLARLLGAQKSEVVAMNSLTTNLHLALLSFYRPTQKRFRIVIEKNAFPSDRYAVLSHLAYHGIERAALIELEPRKGEDTLHTSDILTVLKGLGSSAALVLLGHVQYLTGQAFELKPIAECIHRHGGFFGVDIAHGIGNLDLKLHHDGVDFAVWCSYKYLNAGPGTIGGFFLHQRHRDRTTPLQGWWGHHKHRRFLMEESFKPMAGAEGWQLSNPPITSLALLRAALDIFDKTDIKTLREKSIALTSYLEKSLSRLGPAPHLLTPKDSFQRGAHLAFRVRNGKTLVKKLRARGIIVDFRSPDVLRIAPAPLYNTLKDIDVLVTALFTLWKEHALTHF